MTTATLPDVTAPPAHWPANYSWLPDAIRKMRPGEALTLAPVNWAGYQSILAAREEWGGRGRIWYHAGSLVIMTTAILHERWKTLLGRLLETITLAQNVPLVGCGNMTISREDVDAGLEPDECYYVQRATAMATARALDFTVDPPPDLALEVENTRRLGGKTDIYAALGIPELWRFNGRRLRFFRLTTDQEYVEITHSLAFPWLTPAMLAGYLARVGTIDDTTVCRELFDWVLAHHPQP